MNRTKNCLCGNNTISRSEFIRQVPMKLFGAFFIQIKLKESIDEGKELLLVVGERY